MNVLEDIIYPAVDQSRGIMDKPEHFVKAPETPLLGANTVLDSLGLVAFLVGVEKEITKKLDRSITLANEKALSRKKSPFQTINTLALYIEELLNESN